jgi:hypothetical protein
MTPTTHDQMTPAPPAGGAQTAEGGLTGAAREEAGHLKDSTVEASQQVAGTAKEKAADVASDVRQQTGRLAGETRDQVAQQAGQQRDRAIDGLRSVGDELRGMAEHGQSGWAAQLVRQGAELTDQVADFLQDRGAADILDDVRSLARKRPGTFLLVAAAAGVTAGRLSRAMAAGRPDRWSERTEIGSTGATPASIGSTGTAYAETAGTGTGEPLSGRTRGVDELTPQPDDYLVEPPTPTPTAPDPAPGTPVQPRFGPGAGR